MLRETDLPPEKEWETYFRAETILFRLGLRRGMFLLDLGCGYGTFSIPAAQIVGKKGSVYAVDIDPEMVKIVRRKGRRLKLRNLHVNKGDILTINEKKLGISKSLDMILLANIIHGTRRKTHLLKTLRRLLRSSGLILVINWKLKKTPRGPPMKMRPSEKVTVESLVRAGYSSPRILELPPYHYAVLARQSSEKVK